MLGDRFSFKADAETVRERPTKNSLKTTEVLLGMCLPKFGIYQGTVAPN